jgi:p-aminobenzoyl-glutamate transporter AbgT
VNLTLLPYVLIEILTHTALSLVFFVVHVPTGLT